MMYHRKIGAADVYNLVELIAPTHDPAFVFAPLSAESFAEAAEILGPNQVGANGKLIIAIQIWLIKVGDEIILVDSGVGNHKSRGLPRFDQLNTTVMTWLESVGAGPEQITQVINTHLHGDHVGYNTKDDGNGGWVATFPNAQYFMPQKDYDYWRDAFDGGNPGPEAEALEDSVFPLVDQGRVEFYHEGHEFTEGLTASPAFGHSPGQMRLNLESRGEKGLFCADVFHSPLQILHPELNTPFCAQPDIAQSTRAALLEEIADSNTLLMPCHFGPPHCGYVETTATGYRFVPETRS